MRLGICNRWKSNILTGDFFRTMEDASAVDLELVLEVGFTPLIF
jgi:hypothetical protein